MIKFEKKNQSKKNIKKIFPNKIIKTSLAVS